MRNFASPHVHTDSLDTGSTVEAFVARELELGTGAVTATDHGTMGATRTVYDLAQKKKLTPILGMEAYLRDDDCSILKAAGAVKDDDGTYGSFFKYGHFCAHLLDQPAYELASTLLSRADKRAEQHGSERKPLFAWEQVEQLGAQNVTLTSGCLVGVVAQHLLERGDARTAVRYYEKMRSCARPGNFYVEVFPHDCSHDWVDAIFVDLEDGERLRYSAKKGRYKGKLLRVSGEEVRADQLLNRKAWGELQSVKDYYTWNDREPKKIVKVERIENFIANECKPWMLGEADVQLGVNRFLVGLARKYGDPVLISDDAHYATRDDKIVQDVRLAQSGNWRFWGSYHRYTGDEAFAHFQKTLGTTEREFEGWLDNNQAWAERFKGFQLVAPPSLPTKFYAQDTLPHLLQCIKERGRMRWRDRRYLERLAVEIQLIHKNGTIDFLPYFDMARDVVDQYRNRGIITGPGRGSAAGVLIAYLLHITHVDPLRYDLSLERFMTPDRIKDGAFPDLDLDFPHREVLDGPEGHPEEGWLQQRFGDHCCQISTNLTLKVKAACKDVARMLHGFVPPDVEELTKRFELPPQGKSDRDFVFGYRADDGSEIPGSITYDVALQQYAAAYPRDWTIVQKCLGLNRAHGRHASGYVVLNRPVTDLMPTMTVSGHTVTQFTASAVEAMGGVKMDFLVVRSLNDIGDCVRMVQERSGVPIPKEGMVLEGRGLVPAFQLIPHQGRWIDVWDPPEEDAVMRKIASGDTISVFQFNTPGAVGWLRYFDANRPDGRPALSTILDLATFTALDRPGPLDAFVSDPETPGGKHNMLVEYARRVQGKPPSPDILPIMEQLLPKTNGIMAFQEQLQYMYQQLTGCTGSEAEQFRRDVSKKKADKVEKAFSFFFPRASTKIGEDGARVAWDSMRTFAAYGFNLSHAVCYAMIGYVCAWLKHHYPLEWWCSVLRNASKDKVVEVFWKHAGHLIDLPRLSRATKHFEIANERIAAPIDLLHGVGEAAHAQLIAGAPYASLHDLVTSIQAYKQKHKRVVQKTKRNKKTGEETVVDAVVLGRSAITRGVIYAMIIVGAMDDLLPEEVRKATVLEQLAYFEQVMAEVVGARRPKPVKEWYGKVGALGRYVLKKKILPAYAEDMLPVVAELGLPELTRRKEISGEILYSWRGRRVASASTLKYLEGFKPMPPRGFQLVALAYVLDVRKFVYHGSKQAAEFLLDVAGESFKMVAWPKKGTVLAVDTDVKGSLVLADVERWKDDRGFSVNGLTVIQRPVKEAKDDDGEEGSKETEGAGGVRQDDAA